MRDAVASSSPDELSFKWLHGRYADDSDVESNCSLDAASSHSGHLELHFERKFISDVFLGVCK
jgi:hypothetical protein